jgi:hypothetical protein
MLRTRFIVLFLVVVLVLICVTPVAAQDPDPSGCFPTCYAWNQPNQPSGPGSGTSNSPWSETVIAWGSIETEMKEAAVSAGSSCIVKRFTCANSTQTSCGVVQYTFFADGRDPETQQLGSERVPWTGVLLPFTYILGGGALLGVLAIGLGLVLGRRARRLSV